MCCLLLKKFRTQDAKYNRSSLYQVLGRVLYAVGSSGFKCSRGKCSLYMGFLLRQGRKLSDRCGIFAACSAWDGRAADAIHHGGNNPGYFIWTSLSNIIQSVLTFSFPGIVAHS